MLRAAALAICFSAVAAQAWACRSPDSQRHILYWDLPADAAPDALILNVVILTDWSAYTPGAARARVIDVVQGVHESRYVYIAPSPTTCTIPLQRGAEGMVIGRFERGPEGRMLFIPEEERADDRAARGGRTQPP